MCFDRCVAQGQAGENGDRRVLKRPIGYEGLWVSGGGNSVCSEQGGPGVGLGELEL